MRIAIRFSLHVLAAVALTACGGAASGSDQPAGGARAGGQTADLAVVATDLAFDPDQATVAAGEVTVALDNQGQAAHTWVIEGIEGKIKLDTAAGAQDVGTVELESGTYTFYCDVPGHRAAGMEGTLTVQ